MRKKVKLILLVLILLFVTFILCLNYQTHFSEAARKGKANIENVKKVEKGMTVDEVISLMGEPDMTDYCDLDSVSRGFNYKTNDESFVHVTVCFDSTMTVKETYYPKN
jgi:outer membrane protein assembly factor BamE (lipoprotein component of BamABCDE complex)